MFQLTSVLQFFISNNFPLLAKRLKQTYGMMFHIVHILERKSVSLLLGHRGDTANSFTPLFSNMTRSETLENIQCITWHFLVCSHLVTVVTTTEKHVSFPILFCFRLLLCPGQRPGVKSGTVCFYFYYHFYYFYYF